MFDLSGNGGCLRLNVAAWEFVLDQAVEYGWKPAGTVALVWEAPDCPFDDVEEVLSGQDRNWSGTYRTNDFQTVTDQDARAMSAALKRALLYSDDPDRRRLLLRASLFASAGEFVIG